jgi:hypothetical protein
MNGSTEQNHSRGGLIVRLILILLGLSVLGCLLVMGGRLLFDFGQRTAENIAGVSETLTAIPTQTLTLVPSTVTITPTSGPSPTPTFFHTIPTATATLIPWTQCPGIVVTVNDTAQGDMLHVLRCEDGFEYDIGPLSKGAFAVSPDDKYLVYAGVNGILYAAKIGDPALYTIMNLRKEGPFVAFPKKVVPKFELHFIGEAPPFVLEVYEAKYSQNFPVRMPNWLSQ